MIRESKYLVTTAYYTIWSVILDLPKHEVGSIINNPV